jgi:phosphate starvation-inducible PhoH-like protein
LPSTKKLAFDDRRSLQLLMGSPPEDKRVVEEIHRATGVTLHLRGAEVLIEGDSPAVETVEQALLQLYALVRRGRGLAPRDVPRAVDVLLDDANASLEAVFDDMVVSAPGSRGVSPRSLAQKRYVEAMRKHALVFGIGPAGTGKTFLAVSMAVRRLLDKEVRRIVLTRPAVEAGESLGFLPGTFEEKVSPYLRPLFDALFDLLDPQRVQKFVEQGIIEVAPLAYMRGRTLSDAFVILDEAQNTTREQMKMLLTRMGERAWCVVTGDPSQVDLPGGTRSGLMHAASVLRGVPGIAQVRFSEADVMRHPLVQDIVRAYAKDEAERERIRLERREREPGGPG